MQPSKPLMSYTADDQRMQAILAQSRLLGLLLNPWRRLQQGLAPAMRHSRSLHLLPPVSLLMSLLLIFSLPFASSGQNGILMLAAAGLTFVRLLLCPDEAPRFGRLFVWVGLFVAWGLVATGFSPFFKLSLAGYAKTISYFLAYLALLVNLRSVRQVRLSLQVMLLAAVIVSLYGLYQWHIKVPPLALWDDPTAQYTLTRVYSFLGNPNLLSGYLLPTFALSCFLLLALPRLWHQLCFAPLLVVQLLCIYFTYSRGAWIALAAGAPLGLLLWLRIDGRHLLSRRQGKILLALGLLLALGGLIALFVLNPALSERVSSLFSGREHSSNNFRVNVWMSSIAILRDYGWTGIGMGNKVFQAVYTYYMASGFKALSTYNVPLEVWVEMGIVGLLLFMGLLLAHARRVWQALSDDQPASREARLLLAGALLALWMLMVHGMVDTVFYRPPVQVMFWYALAIISGVSHHVFSGGPASGAAAGGKISEQG